MVSSFKCPPKREEHSDDAAEASDEGVRSVDVPITYRVITPSMMYDTLMVRTPKSVKASSLL